MLKKISGLYTLFFIVYFSVCLINITIISCFNFEEAGIVYLFAILITGVLTALFLGYIYSKKFTQPITIILNSNFIVINIIIHIVLALLYILTWNIYLMWVAIPIIILIVLYSLFMYGMLGVGGKIYLKFFNKK